MAQALSPSVIEACRIAAGDPPLRESLQVVPCSGDDVRVWRGGEWARARSRHKSKLRKARAYPGEIAVSFDATLFPSVAYLITADGPVAIPTRAGAKEIEVVLPNGRKMVLPRPRQ